MTYELLDYQAKAIAATLQAWGVKRGDRVLLVLDSGIPFIQAFFGCLYAGCVAVPVYPPVQEKLMERVTRIIADSQPFLALMTQAHSIKFTENSIKSQGFGLPSINIDTIEPAMADLWHPVNIHDGDVAFLQYTSGSTMHPKGVIISHHNLMANIKIIFQAYEMNEETKILSWVPAHHDMGLIGAILTPVYGGIPTILSSSFSFLQNPLSWLQNITQFKPTITGAPNFAYDYCLKRIREEKKAGLDLSSWKVALNGAEPVRAETLVNFFQAFKNYGFTKGTFNPCYGLAEATLMVTTNKPGTPYETLTIAKEQYQDHRVHFAVANTPGSHTLVSNGRMVQTVKIVDPHSLTQCAVDQIGEIWIHGPSIAQGYWQQPEETKHTFHGQIKENNSGLLYLRTGDLGFIHEEQLYVTGRIKDLIILYGKNYYPQDIEYTIMHSALQEFLGKCAAFVVQNNQDYALTLLCEIKDSALDKTIQDELFNTIYKLVYQAHQLEIDTIAFIPLEELPQTSSGKIRRNFCRIHLEENKLTILNRWQLKSVKV